MLGSVDTSHFVINEPPDFLFAPNSSLPSTFAYQAKLQDQIGKQSSLADEAASYQHFEEMPWAPWGEWHRGRSLQIWSNFPEVMENELPWEWPSPEILDDFGQIFRQIFLQKFQWDDFWSVRQDDAKRSQEQLRALTACVKEAAKASDRKSNISEKWETCYNMLHPIKFFIVSFCGSLRFQPLCRALMISQIYPIISTADAILWGQREKVPDSFKKPLLQITILVKIEFNPSHHPLSKNLLFIPGFTPRGPRYSHIPSQSQFYPKIRSEIPLYPDESL